MNKWRQLVTADEARHIMTFMRSDEIKQVGTLANQLDPKDEDDPAWNNLCKLIALYTAGRLQGIREERSRRAGRSSANGEDI